MSKYFWGDNASLLKHLTKILNCNNYNLPMILSTRKIYEFQDYTNILCLCCFSLAAGNFHREEVPIEAVKQHMRDKGIETR
jgi:imidazole glycerol phosphate synthase subunit HisF